MRFITNTILLLSKNILTRLQPIILMLFFLSHSAFSQYQAAPYSNPVTLTAALVYGRQVLISYNMGGHWQEVTSLPEVPYEEVMWSNVTVVSDNRLLVMRSGRTEGKSSTQYWSDIYLSTNRGQSWNKVYGAKSALTRVAVSPDQQHLVAIGQVDLYSEDGGAHWASTAQETGSEPSSQGNQVLFVTDQVVLQMTPADKNTIKRSADGGKVWTTVTMPTIRNVEGCGLGGAVNRGTGKIIVACKVAETDSDNGGADLYISSNHGVTWQFADKFDQGKYDEIQMAYLVDDKTLISLNSFTEPGTIDIPVRTLRRSADGGITWQDFTPNPVSAEKYVQYRNMVVTDQKVMILASNGNCDHHSNLGNCYVYGTVLVSLDQGVTWKAYHDGKVAQELVDTFYRPSTELPVSSLPTEIPALGLEVNTVIGETFWLSTCDNQFMCTKAHYGIGYNRRWNIPVGEQVCVITSAPFGRWRAYPFKVIGPGFGQINYWGTVFNPNFNWTASTLEPLDSVNVNWVPDDNNHGMVVGSDKNPGCQCRNCDEGP